MDEYHVNLPEVPKKSNKKSNRIIIVVLLLLILIAVLMVSFRDKDQDVLMIESLKFIGEPNQTTIDVCNNLFNNTKPQTYFRLMYDCVGPDTLEKVEVIIPRENVTMELLDSQCECIKVRADVCRKYKCGENEVWGKI